MLPIAYLLAAQATPFNFPITGVAPVVDTNWDTIASKRFKELTLDKYFYCQLKEACPNGRSLVSLLGTGQSQLLSTALVAEKLAKII